MKMKYLTTALTLFTFIAFSVSGQIVIPDKLIKKSKEVGEEINTKATEKEINKELDKAFNHIEKKYSKEDRKNKNSQNNDSDSEAQNYNKILNDFINNSGASSEPVKYEDKYIFTSSVSMEFSTLSKDGKEENKGYMVSFYNPDEKYTAYEFMNADDQSSKSGEAGIFILDFDNKATVVLSVEDDSNSGIVYGMDDNMSEKDLNNAIEENSSLKAAQEENPLLKKTGRTKTIAGYKCEEYKYDDNNISSKMWITKDIHWNNHDLMQKAFSGSMYSNAVPNGFLMESETKDKSTGEKMIFRVTEINKDISITFDMSKYNITNIGKVTMPSGFEDR